MRILRFPSERALVSRLQAGETEAVAELATTHGPHIFRLAVRLLENHEDAEELTQDVLFLICRRIRGFRHDAALASWIHRITFNAAMSRLRRLRSRRRAEVVVSPRSSGGKSEDGTDPFEPLDLAPAPDELAFREEQSARLRLALDLVPLPFRSCVELCHLNGFSTKEASALLRVKPQTVKARVYRGRWLLRKHLEILDFENRCSSYTLWRVHPSPRDKEVPRGKHAGGVRPGR